MVLASRITFVVYALALHQLNVLRYPHAAHPYTKSLQVEQGTQVSDFEIELGLLDPSEPAKVQPKEMEKIVAPAPPKWDWEIDKPAMITAEMYFQTTRPGVPPPLSPQESPTSHHRHVAHDAHDYFAPAEAVLPLAVPSSESEASPGFSFSSGNVLSRGAAPEERDRERRPHHDPDPQGQGKPGPRLPSELFLRGGRRPYRSAHPHAAIPTPRTTADTGLRAFQPSSTYTLQLLPFVGEAEDGRPVGVDFQSPSDLDETPRPLHLADHILGLGVENEMRTDTETTGASHTQGSWGSTGISIYRSPAAQYDEEGGFNNGCPSPRSSFGFLQSPSASSTASPPFALLGQEHQDFAVAGMERQRSRSPSQDVVRAEDGPEAGLFLASSPMTLQSLARDGFAFDMDAPAEKKFAFIGQVFNTIIRATPADWNETFGPENMKNAMGNWFAAETTSIGNAALVQEPVEAPSPAFRPPPQQEHEQEGGNGKLKEHEEPSTKLSKGRRTRNKVEPAPTSEPLLDRSGWEWRTSPMLHRSQLSKATPQGNLSLVMLLMGIPPPADAAAAANQQPKSVFLKLNFKADFRMLTATDVAYMRDVMQATDPHLQGETVWSVFSRVLKFSLESFTVRRIWGGHLQDHADAPEPDEGDCIKALPFDKKQQERRTPTPTAATTRQQRKVAQARTRKAAAAGACWTGRAGDNYHAIGGTEQADEGIMQVQLNEWVKQCDQARRRLQQKQFLLPGAAGASGGPPTSGTSAQEEKSRPDHPPRLHDNAVAGLLPHEAVADVQSGTFVSDQVVYGEEWMQMLGADPHAAWGSATSIGDCIAIAGGAQGQGPAWDHIDFGAKDVSSLPEMPLENVSKTKLALAEHLGGPHP